jgi:hypothetical protein
MRSVSRASTGQHELGDRAVAELGGTVVLDRPPAAVAELVGEPRLLDRVEVHLALAHRIAAPRALQLGEDVEHERTLRHRAPRGRPLDGGHPDPDATPMSRWKPLSLFHFTLSVSSIEPLDRLLYDDRFRLLRDNRDVIWPDYVAPQFGLERAPGPRRAARDRRRRSPHAASI